MDRDRHLERVSLLVVDRRTSCSKARQHSTLSQECHSLLACCTIGPDEQVQDKKTMMDAWKALPQWLTTVALDQNVHGAASLAERMRQGRIDIKARQREEKKTRKRLRMEVLPRFETDGELERATSSARSS